MSFSCTLGSLASQPLTPNGNSLGWILTKNGEPHPAHSALRGSRNTITVERAMVESPREVCICNKSNPLQNRNESEVHKRTHGASTIASFLTVIQNFLRFEEPRNKAR